MINLHQFTPVKFNVYKLKGRAGRTFIEEDAEVLHSTHSF